MPLGAAMTGDTDADVAIVEAEQAGFGASGRNGGWASSLFPASLNALARRSSRGEAVRMKRT
ncbi:MAG: FAD-dependent oxidoreductase, partial [Actinomycetota bacterium]|nr:FAD-dependent oxidoreductase [Actinomycetota bacterium]